MNTFTVDTGSVNSFFVNSLVIIKKLTIVLTLIFVTACVQNKNIYYWGDYSDTLYATKKEPSAESKERHYRELLNIINNAQSYEKKIPPGIYFELSMYESEKGNHDKANILLNQEYSLYPEAKTYIENLRVGDKNE
ncbi:hypothetical protein GCM10008107_21010 [Psychrosphaera saromensis]|uniref:DUF4810 domain-containing protein n=1 Tax=Psychrosphaera saromensis TaxID=716813 RepID=UPI000CF3E3C2|nr:DUF4810 domain-containing protein [Psychrosphaera saromensis]GHB71281.1 hypothetical protein GCM10008107_21010 [Psychrosphaera saromensis]GLQ13287.1 hypothetical protein GCM10007917_07420 [Psychrosphaera saromensis]